MSNAGQDWSCENFTSNRHFSGQSPSSSREFLSAISRRGPVDLWAPLLDLYEPVIGTCYRNLEIYKLSDDVMV